MENLISCIENLLASLDADQAKLAHAARNNAIYMDAVRKVWKDPEASEFILAHTNAFYIRKDETPKKGIYKDRDYMVCEICIDDPTVRSDIDAHRELLQLALRNAGMTFEEVRLIAAKRGMRKRHPFIREDR